MTRVTDTLRRGEACAHLFTKGCDDVVDTRIADDVAGVHGVAPVAPVLDVRVQKRAPGTLTP
eukprot:1720953-Prymnesium_polylepis.4